MEVASPEDIGWPAVEVANPDAEGAAVLVCEHASPFVPPSVALGLAAADALSHAAWDPGAALVARRMAARLGAPLVMGTLSRLVFDCNRPPEAPDAIVARSELIDVPGNRNLAPEARAARARAVHAPFHETLGRVLARRPAAALVTVHSFTPVYAGRVRAVELGLLHDADARMARALLPGARARWAAALNEPYSAADGVTHTLRLHGLGRPSVMIEIRNDLLADPAAAQEVGDVLAGLVAAALAELGAAA